MRPRRVLIFFFCVLSCCDGGVNDDDGDDGDAYKKEHFLVQSIIEQYNLYCIFTIYLCFCFRWPSKPPFRLAFICKETSYKISSSYCNCLLKEKYDISIKYLYELVSIFEYLISRCTYLLTLIDWEAYWECIAEDCYWTKDILKPDRNICGCVLYRKKYRSNAR